jgi:excisionase family DNA binding protein
MTGDVISVSQAAERLHVSPQSVRNWLRSGRLSGKRVGSQWWVRESEVREMERKLPHRAQSPSSLQSELRDLSDRVLALENSLQFANAERDRFRAEAAAAKSAALEANGVAAEMVRASKQLVGTLELQIAATSQLLTPASLSE